MTGEKMIRDVYTLYEESSLVNWYPKIEDLVKTPETKIFPFTSVEKVVRNIMNFVTEHRWHPLFIRTDALSDKHQFYQSCFLGGFPSKSELIKRISFLLDKHEMAIPPLPLHAIVIRKYLTPKVYFHAFRGLPIAPEWRFIIHNHKIVAEFPYWYSKDIFLHGNHGNFWGEASVYYEIAEDLEHILKEMNSVDHTEAREQAKKIAEVIDGNWSVDAMLTWKHGWVIIDMARAEVSWMPEEIRANMPFRISGVMRDE